MEASKRRTITLTGRSPVRILDADWPIIASASGDSFTGNDGARHLQAQRQGELDEWWLKVRQHYSDGRTLVYGRITHGWHGGEDWAGGMLLEPGADIAAALHSVGCSSPIPAECFRDCLAALPPVDL